MESSLEARICSLEKAMARLIRERGAETEALQEGGKNKSFHRAVFDVTLGVALGWVIMMTIMYIN